MKAIYQWESTQAAPVSIALKRSYDATTRQLTVQVGMKQVEGQTIGNKPALTLCIIENNIVAYQYPEGDNYVHQKANRAFLTQALGDPVSLSTDAPLRHLHHHARRLLEAREHGDRGLRGQLR